MEPEKLHAQRNVIWHNAVQGVCSRENVDVLLLCAGAKGNVCVRVRRHGPRQMRWHISCEKRMRQQCRVGAPVHSRRERCGGRNAQHGGIRTINVRERIGARRGSLEGICPCKGRGGWYTGNGRVRVRRAQQLGGRSVGRPGARWRGEDRWRTSPAATSKPRHEAKGGVI